MRRGFTLIEVLTVVAIIAILVTITIGIGLTVDTAMKKSKTETAIKLLVAGLEQYHDFWGEFPLIKNGVNDKVDSAYDETDLATDTDIGFGVGVIAVNPISEYASIEGLYFWLGRTPPCRKILDKIDNSLVTAKEDNGSTRTVTVTIDSSSNTNIYKLFRVIDAWKTPLRYIYDSDNDSFPVIESAGPDKEFSTEEDNITSQ